jgi:hypothetical protein
MNPDLPQVDGALGAVRALLEDAGAKFKIVAGVAVVHHGYARTTVDVDVLLGLDEVRYTEVKAAVDRDLRPALADLRRDALEELADDGGEQ